MMQICLKKFDEEREISSYDEVHIVLSRLEAIRLSADLGDLDPARTNAETVHFCTHLKKLIRLPDALVGKGMS